MPQSEQLQNLALVEELCRILELPDYRPELMLPYFTEDCAIRFMESMPFAVGHDAMLDQARQLMPLGTERMRVKFISTQATGPMVIAHRIDTLLVPDQPEIDFEMLGVFHIVGGRIREWTDFMLTPYTIGADGIVTV